LQSLFGNFEAELPEGVEDRPAVTFTGLVLPDAIGSASLLAL
jgi:hypothetical protein